MPGGARIAFDVFTTMVFISVACLFLFPSNRYLPLDRRMAGLIGAALCSCLRWIFPRGNDPNPGNDVDVQVLLILVAIMAINFVIMRQPLLLKAIHMMQQYIRKDINRGYWAVAASAFIISPFITNDGLCLLMVSPVLDAFDQDFENDDGVNEEVFYSSQDPFYFMLAIACSANIGSVTTFSGNPQNIIIAQYLSKYMNCGLFFAIQIPPATASWFITIGLLNYYRVCAAAAERAGMKRNESDVESSNGSDRRPTEGVEMRSLVHGEKSDEMSSPMSDRLSVLTNFFLPDLHHRSRALHIVELNELSDQQSTLIHQQHQHQHQQESKSSVLSSLTAQTAVGEEVVSPFSAFTNNSSGQQQHTARKSLSVSTTKRSAGFTPLTTDSPVVTPKVPRHSPDLEAQHQHGEEMQPLNDSDTNIIEQSIPEMMDAGAAATTESHGRSTGTGKKMQRSETPSFDSPTSNSSGNEIRPASPVPQFNVNTTSPNSVFGSLSGIAFPFFFCLIALEFAGIFPLVAIFAIIAVFLVIAVLLGNYYRGQPTVDLFGRPIENEDRIAGIAAYTEELFKDLDYNLLIIFSGLFIVSGSFVSTNIPSMLWYAVAGKAAFQSFPSLLCISIYVIIASQLVGNVPVVYMAREEIEVLPESTQTFGWCILAWVSTVAGNFTLAGSAANIIVAEKAIRHKKVPVAIQSIPHFKICGAVTIVCIALGVFILYIESLFIF